MTAQSKTIIKTYFETGDRPTEGQFSDLIDSYQDVSSLLNNIVSAASAGAGFINVINTSAVSLVPSGTVGVQILAANTTAAVQNIVGVTTPGTLGAQLIATNTTAQAVNVLGAGTVGAQIFAAQTTAQAQAPLGFGSFGIGSGTYQPVFTSAVNVNAVSAAPWTYSVNASAVVVSGNLTITNAAANTLSEIFVSLPILSTFAAKSNCSGVFTTETTAQTGGIACVAAQNRARINYIARSTDPILDCFVMFQYRVLP